MFFLYNIAGKNSVAIPHEQWYLAKNTKYAINIGVQEMWEIVEMEKIKHIVTVAIIDGGIDILNPEISASLWKNIDEIPNNGIDDDNNGYIDDINGWNFVDDNENVSEYKYSTCELSHGTTIAGIISANPYIGKVCGIANGNYVKLMPLKILHTISGEEIAYGSVEDIICAIQYAESNGADICNISLNMDQYIEYIAKAKKNARYYKRRIYTYAKTKFKGKKTTSYSYGIML